MTVSNPDQPFEQLVQKLVPQSRLLRTWRLDGGISAEMTAFEMERPDGQRRRMIVRRPGERTLARNPQTAADEFRILNMTYSLGLATPRPCHLDQSGEIFPTPYLVMEYIEGRPVFAPANRANFTLQLATYLARIHRVDGSHLDLTFLSKQTRGFAGNFGERPAEVNQSLEEERIRDALEPAWPLPQRNASVLLHGDFWPGNVLWQEDQIVAVIDWEDAKSGDPLMDLAISRLDLAWIFGIDAMHSFTEHYQSRMVVDTTDLPYWDLYAALRLIRLAGSDLAEWVAFFPPWGRHDITEHTMREDVRSFIAQAFERLTVPSADSLAQRPVSCHLTQSNFFQTEGKVMPKRLAITAPYQVEVMAYEDPPLQENQVLVQTELASGKHGTTMGMFDGRSFEGQRFDQTMRLFVAQDKESPPPMPSREQPWKAGTTGVGTVVAVGSEVTRWQEGDRVFGLMDVRETNICDQNRLWALGEIEPTLALCLEPAYVAFHAVREAGVRYGDQVAVIGLGVLGLLAVRMAVQSGAEAVYAVDVLPGRRGWAAQHGATHVFDPQEGDVARQIHQANGGPGVDVAIELAGAYPALQTAIRSVRVGGTVCSAGFYQGESKGLWLGREWHHNRINVVVPHGCGWGHPPRDYPRWDEARAYDAIASLMRQGKLTAPDIIRPIVSLTEAAEVFRLIRHEPDRVIKYAVRF